MLNDKPWAAWVGASGNHWLRVPCIIKIMEATRILGEDEAGRYF